MNNTPLYIYIFFILAFISRHLGFFHILAIVVNAVNVEVQLSLQILIFILSDKCPEVGLLNYIVVLFVIFKSQYCFSEWLQLLHSHQYYIKVTISSHLVNTSYFLRVFK